MKALHRQRRRLAAVAASIAAFALLGAGVSSAAAASPGWKLLAFTGPTNLPPVTSEIQEVAIDATGGTFTLTFAGQETPVLAFDASPAEVKVALDSLSTIGGAGAFVEVSGGPVEGEATHSYFARFRGELAGTDVAEMTADSGSLTGGTGAAVSTETEGGLPGEGLLLAYATNVGGAATTGTVTVTLGPFPAGIETAATASGTGWECLPAGAGQTTVTCTRSDSTPALGAVEPIAVPLLIGSAAAASSTVAVTVEGGGAAVPDVYEAQVSVSEADAGGGVQALWAAAFDEDGALETQAGGHPAAAGTMFFLNTKLAPSGRIKPAADPKDIVVDLPPGFVGNPMVTPQCPRTRIGCKDPGVEIGEAKPFLTKFPPTVTVNDVSVANDEPANGYAAQFTFALLETRASAVASLRSDEDYGVTVTASNIPPFYSVYGNYLVLYGSPPGAGGNAFLTNPTGCALESAITPVTDIFGTSWQPQSLIAGNSVEISPVQNCGDLSFDPVFTFQPSTDQGASPSGATAHLHVDQERLLDPNELAPPHLKKSVVTLPEGMNVNPSAANGLEACSTAQMGYKGGNFPAPNPTRFTKDPVNCPDASKLGTVEVDTPLFEDTFNGTVYLASQGDNPFGSLIALYLVVEDERTGITLKIPGKVTPNEATGQLTAEFDNNPQAPFTDLTLHLRGGGPRSTMATPDTCGTHTTNGSWTPWSAPESGPPATTINSFEVSGNCAPTKAQRPFAPGFSAGVTDPVAGKHSPFVLRLTRPDGHQELGAVEVALPPGFTAALKGVATCSDAQLAQALARSNPGDGQAEIASPSCPASSQIGTTTVGAGVGPEPIYVDTGRAYLTGPYKGAPVSLSFVVPAVTGPFDLGVQVVRTALRIDPKTAQITAESDPIPQILEGIPLHIRDVRVAIDRPGFALNPTSCEAMQIAGRATGGSGAAAPLANRFQVGDCAALGFEPRTNVRLFGGIARGKYQGVRAVVRPRPGDANISRTVVRFPRSAFVAQEHLKDICTRVQYAADACPKRSVYGRAIAYSPLLDEPLKGNVYLRSSDNALPDLVADLRGPAHQPIRVEVAVRNDSVKGALRNTVQAVPDAPVSYFRLQTFGKAKGLIVNSRNICKGRNQARVAMSAHNGRRSVQNVNVFNKRCKAYKRKLRKNKRRAKRAAHRSVTGATRRGGR